MSAVIREIIAAIIAIAIVGGVMYVMGFYVGGAL